MTSSIEQQNNNTGTGYPGQAGVWANLSDFNKQYFLVQQLIGTIRTVTLVQVQSCSNADTVDAVGTVDVLPLVNMMDGAGKTYQHETIYNVPYFRLQGGKNAIIADPQKGDIGIALFADRDISSVKNSKKQGNPGSRRRYAFADALYIGGVLNDVPQQYLRFKVDSDGNPAGMEMVDKFANSIVMDTNGIVITSYKDLTIQDANSNSLLMKASNSELTLNTHTLTQHVHTQGNDSHGDTEVPTNKPTG